MVKKIVNKEVTVCDLCGSSDSVFYTCLVCKKDICFKCMNEKKLGVEYHRGNAGNKAEYCNECNMNGLLKKLSPKDQDLFDAFRWCVTWDNESDDVYRKRREIWNNKIKEYREKFNTEKETFFY